MPTPIREMFTIIVSQVVTSFAQSAKGTASNIGSQKFERTVDGLDGPALRKRFTTDLLNHSVLKIVQTSSEMNDFSFAHIDPVMMIKPKIN
jgi:hypothetical protein